MQAPSQEFDFNFSIYISSEDEDARKELAARPVNKEVLIKAMSELKLEGEWRITQTSCGIIVSFMRESDMLAFQELDLSSALGVPASAYSYSSLDTYRQKVLIRDVPWVITGREVETALIRQGIVPLALTRTRHGNIILELSDPVHFNILLADGFDFFGSARFAAIPLPSLPPLVPPPLGRDIGPQMPRQDSILQCYKCQGFWHYAAQCQGAQRCVRCGDGHPVSECPRPRNDPLCVHCSGRHHAAYRHCPVRLQMMRTFVPIYLPSTTAFIPAAPFPNPS